MRTNQDNIYNVLKETLEGEVLCDLISRTEMNSTLADFNKWCKTANTGDEYWYNGCRYTFINYDEAIKADMSPVSAYEFCDFFEFTLERSLPDQPFVDDEGDEYKYQATDNQEAFHTRYANDVTELADMFESMEGDYVDSTLDDYGFDIDEYDVGYYEAALAWILSTREGSELKGTDTYNVIRVFVHPELLVDDK